MIKQAISDICISMKAEDYITLPDVLYNDIPVVLDPAAVKAYQKLETDLLLQVDESTITAGTAGVLTGKLLQLCNGAIYDENRVPVTIHNCKIDAFLELVEQLNGQHALVFYNFQHDRDRLVEALTETGLRVRVYSRPQDEEDWNNGEIDLLLAHPASCGYGLNLQRGGYHAIWFGLSWSLEQYEQARPSVDDIADRLHIDKRTFYRDINRAMEDMAVLLFGIEAIGSWKHTRRPKAE